MFAEKSNRITGLEREIGYRNHTNDVAMELKNVWCTNNRHGMVSNDPLWLVMPEMCIFLRIKGHYSLLSPENWWIKRRGKTGTHFCHQAEGPPQTSNNCFLELGTIVQYLSVKQIKGSFGWIDVSSSLMSKFWCGPRRKITYWTVSVESWVLFVFGLFSPETRNITCWDQI